MKIRKATLEDAEAISTLTADVHSIHADAHPHLFKRPSSESFSVSFITEVLTNPNNHIFIVRVGYMDIGYVYARIVDQPENPFMHARKCIYVDQISIKPTYQGRGYGARLLERVRALARDEGIDTIALDVWHFNEKARAFFMKHGFSTFIERMWIRDEK